MTTTDVRALRSLGTREAELLASMTPENLATQVAQGHTVEYAEQLIALYQALDEMESGVVRTKTITGMYVVEALMNRGGWRNNQVADRMGVTTGRVSQLRRTAQLHFELGFTAADPIWPSLTSRVQNDARMGALLRTEDVTADEVRALHATIVAEPRITGPVTTGAALGQIARLLDVVEACGVETRLDRLTLGAIQERMAQIA